MSIGLTISSIIFLIFLMITIIYLVVKRRISIKYSLVWLFPCLLLIVFTLVPGLMGFISNILGFQTASNMILTLLLCFLMVITIALTIIVTNQKDKIRLLVQEVSILKKIVNSDKKQV